MMNLDTELQRDIVYVRNRVFKKEIKVSTLNIA